MSKKGKNKDLSVDNLVENALDDSSEALAVEEDLNPKEIVNNKKLDSLGDLLPVVFKCCTRVFKNGHFVVVDKPSVAFRPVIYTASCTEQIHALSLSEQIRRGQGEAKDYSEDDKKAYYDFPDGKDDGRAAVGLYELSEPAYAFEREKEFSRVVSSEIKENSLAIQADKAQKNAIEKAQKQAEKDSLIKDVKNSLNTSENG